jgi:hypothetical protein
MAERDLKVNSIRSVKQSPDLVLEEHGHCEVPAGCGGVILRWRQKTRVPVHVWLHTSAAKSVYLDGRALDSGRPLVEPGEHVLALQFSRVEPDAGILMAACLHDEKRFRWGRFQHLPGDPIFLLLSLPDGTWKYATEAPGDDSWMQPGYDDSAWPAMIAREMPEPPKEEGSAARRIKEIAGLGGQALGIDRPAGPTPLWIRRAFILPAYGPARGTS